MGLLNDCQSIYNTQDLYEVLGSTKSANEKELKRSYYKASLKIHPDRVDPKKKEEATVKFQILGKVYSLLSDKDKRALYDEFCEVDDENLSEEMNWSQYWSLFFPKITEADIKDFEKQYRGSEEELTDLKKAYLDGEGSMNFIMEKVLCATVEDEERFEDIIRGWIKEGDVENFDNFSKQTKKQKTARKRKAAREAAEAEAMKAELSMDDSEQSLRQLILKRSAGREAKMNSFLDDLATKYGGGSRETKRSRSKK